MKKKIINMILIIILIISMTVDCLAIVKDVWTTGTGQNGKQHVQYDNKSDTDDEMLEHAKYALWTNGYNESDSFTLPEATSGGSTQHKQIQYNETMTLSIDIKALQNTTDVSSIGSGDVDEYTSAIWLYSRKNESGQANSDSTKIRGNNRQNVSFEEEKNQFFSNMDSLAIPYNDQLKSNVTAQDGRYIDIDYSTTVDIYTWRNSSGDLSFSMDFSRVLKGFNVVAEGANQYYSVDELEEMTGEDPSLDDEYEGAVEDQQERQDGYEAGLTEESAGLEGPNWNYTTGVAGAGAAIENPITSPDTYKPTEEIGDTTEVTNIAVTLIRGVRTIGIIFAVIALMIYGIRYMFGSLEERAEYKETMMPWIIGSLLLVVGTTIVQYIYTIASAINA